MMFGIYLYNLEKVINDSLNKYIDRNPIIKENLHSNSGTDLVI